jgi:Putative beta barrel porin-7 (BBP7)
MCSRFGALLTISAITILGSNTGAFAQSPNADSAPNPPGAVQQASYTDYPGFARPTGNGQPRATVSQFGTVRQQFGTVPQQKGAVRQQFGTVQPVGDLPPAGAPQQAGSAQPTSAAQPNDAAQQASYNEPPGYLPGQDSASPGFAQRHRNARRQASRAVRPAPYDTRQADYNQPMPGGQMNGRAAPMPAADPNFSPTPAAGPTTAFDDDGWQGGDDGSMSMSGTSGGNYTLPRFDNGWCCPTYCPTGCGGFGGWGPRGPIYVRAEYLGWWLKGDNPPALVTTSPGGTAQTAAGVLGQPGTSTLFGGNTIGTGMRSGARIVAGWWLDPTTRIEGEVFGLGNNNASFNEASSASGIPILARPFFNLQTGKQDAFLLAFSGTPGTSSGNISILERSSFMGAGIRALQNLSCVNCCDKQCRWDFIYGFRYLRLAENLTINSSLTAIDTSAPAGTVFTAFDGFKTANNFYGADLGLMSERRNARWSLTTIGRFAIGWTSQTATISGNSSTTQPGGATTTSNGGLLAMPSNIGDYHHAAFTYVPQLELKLGYYLTQNLRLSVGYDLMYWSRVARPGEQISTSVNTSQAGGGTLTGTSGPLFSFHESGLWVQGLSLGGELWF